MLSLFIIVSLLALFPLFSTNNNKNQNSTDTHDFSSTRYLAFGDSITMGNYLEKSYPKLVAERLGCDYYSNMGVGGSTYVYASNRGCIADEVVSALDIVGHYDFISVAGGVNDHDLSYPLGTIDDESKYSIYGSLNIIAQALKTRQKNSFVFFITPIKYDRDRVNNANYKLEDVAKAVIEVGEKYDIPVLDLYSTSEFETVACGMNHAECDGTHPIQEFMDNYMSPKIVRFIKENYNK